jgi:putative DNA primase/helicase
MTSYGIKPIELPIDDGELHRFRVEGDNAHALNGWYVLHGGDLPAGAFGCWKRGISETWSALSKGQMTDKQRKAYEQKLEETRNKRDYERRERQRNAAVKSGQLWIQANTEIDSKHPYLLAKKISPLGIRQLNDTLLVPIQNALQELVNLQRITFDGQKRFMYGGAVQSCYTVLGELIDSAYLCEGYATGVTIRQATQQAVIVAFNAGNISSVIKSLAITNPSLKLILAADNDHQNQINIGIEKAWMASIGFDIPLVYPDFESNDPSSDFNDLANTKGIEAVKEQLSIIRKGVPKCQNT